MHGGRPPRISVYIIVMISEGFLPVPCSSLTSLAQLHGMHISKALQLSLSMSMPILRYKTFWTALLFLEIFNITITRFDLVLWYFSYVI
nr:hypothetical protein CFP56_61009 [Quercus suber]